MNEARLTESLDERGLLTAAQGPGVYALGVPVPSMPSVAREQWDAVHDARPPDDALARLAEAPRVAYVGASSQVYDRLCDHVAGDVRTTAFLAAFDPAAVINVWPHDAPFDAEVTRALRLAREDWVVWCDGEVWG